MLKYKVNIDDKEVRYKLNRLLRKNPELSKRVLGRLSEAIIARTVKTKLSGQVLKRKTGTLAKSLTWRLIGDFSAVVGTNVAYAAIHEYGGKIMPKNGQFLHFNIGDRHIATRQVIMPRRPYLGPSLGEVFSSGEAQRIMDLTTKEYLNGEWEA